VAAEIAVGVVGRFDVDEWVYVFPIFKGLLELNNPRADSLNFRTIQLLGSTGLDALHDRWIAFPSGVVQNCPNNLD
jgi:hypothetical protein